MANSIDPTTMAQTLVSAERAAKDQLLSKQATTVKNQLSGITSLSTQLSTFQTLLKDLNKISTLQAQSSTLSQEGILTATSNGQAANGQYSFFVQQLAQAHQLSMTFSSETDPMPTEGTLSLSVNGKSLDLALNTLPANATLKDLVTAINGNSANPGVQASLVRNNGQVNLLLTSKETGAANSIGVSYVPPATATAASDALVSSLTNKTTISQAKDAIVKLGGDSPMTITSGSNTLTNVVDGLTINLTKAQAAGDAPVTLAVGQDTKAVTEALQKFVDGYNTLVAGLSKLTSNTSESQGALAGDSSTRSLISVLRTQIRQLPGGMSLSSLGIKSDRTGTLSVDSKALSAALEKDPQVLTKALQGDSGLLKKLQTATETYTSRTGMIKQRKESLQRQQTQISEKQTAFNERMERTYQRYLQQFTQLNNVMTQMSQTSSLFA